MQAYFIGLNCTRHPGLPFNTFESFILVSGCNFLEINTESSKNRLQTVSNMIYIFEIFET